MATKNLARTAIEGGRNSYNKYDRRLSSKHERHRANEFCLLAARDADLCEDNFVEARKPVMKDFADKLSPVRKFIAANDGRPWNKVYSEVVKRFDRRTTPGRHILNDHIVREVNPGGKPKSRWRGEMYNGEPYVTAQGILRIHRQKPFPPRSNHAANKWINYHVGKIVPWLNNRLIRKVGTKIYWFVPTTKATIMHRSGIYTWMLSLDWRREDGLPWPIRFRQDRELTREELAFLGMFGEFVKERLLQL